MSNRNNQANKQAARERLRAERERQAKKDRLRRQLIVGGAIVGVLAIAGGIGVAVANIGRRREPRRPAGQARQHQRRQGHHDRRRQAGRQEHPGRSSRTRAAPAAPLRAGRRRHRREGHQGRQVQGLVPPGHVPRRQPPGHRLQERAQRAGRLPQRQPGRLPEVQVRAVLEGVPPGRARRGQVRRRQLPDQGRRHRPGAQGERRLPEGRQGRHVRPVGAGGLQGLRLRQGRQEHPDDQAQRQGSGHADPAGHVGTVQRGRLQLPGGQGTEEVT